MLSLFMNSKIELLTLVGTVFYRKDGRSVKTLEHFRVLFM
jgi:hypothetical protein